MKFKEFLESLPLKEKKLKLTSKINYEFTEDINEYDFVLYEAVSKEQKEAGQREMWKLEQNVINKVEKYFNRKWADIKNLKNKKIEKERLEDLKKYFKKYEPSEKTIKWFKEKIGIKPEFPIGSISNPNSNSPGGVEGHRLFTTFVRDFNVKNITGENRYLNGFDFTEENAKKFENIIWKFIIMHEQGHLYNYLIQAIEKGTVQPIGTAMFNFSEKDKKDVNDSEVGANSYALDNMYRKDRREFLKNSNVKEAEKLERLKDAYTKGLSNKSKTYKKTKDSIEKEKRYFNY